LHNLINLISIHGLSFVIFVFQPAWHGMWTTQTFPDFHKHGSAAKFLHAAFHWGEACYKILVYISLGYCHFLKFRGNPAESNLLGAYLIAGITQTTEPDKLRGKYLCFHSQNNHMNKPTRIKIINHLPNRADAGTRTAGITRLDLLQANLFGYFILEIRIRFFKNNRFQ